MRIATIASTTTIAATLTIGALVSGIAIATDDARSSPVDSTDLTSAYAPLQPGPYSFDIDDMTVDLELEADYWVVLENEDDRTILSDAGPTGPIGRDLMFLAATGLAGDATDISSWLVDHAAAVDGEPVHVTIGGLDALRFDIDPRARGGYEFVVLDDGRTMRLETERDYRVWWIESGDDPIVVIATSDRNDHPLLYQAEVVLDTLRIERTATPVA